MLAAATSLGSAPPHGTRRKSPRQECAHFGQEAVVHRKETVLALAPYRQDVCLGQDLHVMGYRRLRQIEAFDHLPTRELARGRNFLNHAKAVGVGKGLQYPYELLVVHVGLPIPARATGATL